MLSSKSQLTASSTRLVYKFSVDKKTLTMTIEQENGLSSENNQVAEYGRVDRIETRTLSDLLGTITDSVQQETTTDASEE